MALSFNKQTGGAQKSSISTFTYKDGDNKMRVVGDILARYVYWIEGENGKNIPLECLSFDRNSERFTNKEQDWVREYYPLPYNVEYQLQALKCKPRALTEDELGLITDLKSMDEVMTRPTADAQKELLDRVRNAGKDNDDEMLEAEFNVG